MGVRRLRQLLAVCGLTFALATVAFATGAPAPEKAKLVLNATPSVGFAPMRVVFIAELKGGTDEELYCPSIEWHWGDETKTITSADCAPYEAGKSEVKRRWVIDRVYNTAGDMKVELRLKQKDKVVVRGSTNLRVRPGLRDGGDPWIR